MPYHTDTDKNAKNIEKWKKREKWQAKKALKYTRICRREESERERETERPTITTTETTKNQHRNAWQRRIAHNNKDKIEFGNNGQSEIAHEKTELREKENQRRESKNTCSTHQVEYRESEREWGPYSQRAWMRGRGRDRVYTDTHAQVYLHRS